MHTFEVEVGRMARDLSALFRIISIINSVRDREAFQRELLRLLSDVVPFEAGAVVLGGGQQNDADSIYRWSLPEHATVPLTIRRAFIHKAIWERAPVSTGTASIAPDGEHIVCIPLVGIQSTIGTLYLARREPMQPFQENEIYFLDSVSRIGAVTLENILALDSLRSENRRLNDEVVSSSMLVGESPQMEQVGRFIQRVAASGSNILILGESGTGKEVVARAIHNAGARRDLPFIAINCAAIPEALLESELFGHEKGAFTGAISNRKGKLEVAQQGTVFLDEIGELPLTMQTKLLRVLQQREFERLGGNQPIRMQARILAATNRNLEEAIKSGSFRQDLYYRLNVVAVKLPPLRERADDISLLALYFANQYAQKSKRIFRGISPAARRLLLSYSWPGNIRELENAIEHAIVLGVTDEILPEDLPDSVIEEQASRPSGIAYHNSLSEAKRSIVLAALREADGSVPAAARTLGIHPKYLHRLITNLNLRSATK